MACEHHCWAFQLVVVLIVLLFAEDDELDQLLPRQPQQRQGVGWRWRFANKALALSVLHRSGALRWRVLTHFTLRWEERRDAPDAKARAVIEERYSCAMRRSEAAHIARDLSNPAVLSLNTQQAVGHGIPDAPPANQHERANGRYRHVVWARAEAEARLSSGGGTGSTGLRYIMLQDRGPRPFGVRVIVGTQRFGGTFASLPQALAATRLLVECRDSHYKCGYRGTGRGINAPEYNHCPLLSENDAPVEDLLAIDEAGAVAGFWRALCLGIRRACGFGVQPDEVPGERVGVERKPNARSGGRKKDKDKEVEEEVLPSRRQRPAAGTGRLRPGVAAAEESSSEEDTC